MVPPCIEKAQVQGEATEDANEAQEMQRKNRLPKRSEEEEEEEEEANASVNHALPVAHM